MKWMSFETWSWPDEEGPRRKVILNMAHAICISSAPDGGSFIHFVGGNDGAENKWHVAQTPEEIGKRLEWKE